ncbi:hypothetical protein FDE29_13795 [Vibrio parahaemolyticus]|uniref:DUF6012 family protein n=1 Tax=Vibrio parahaemolyticus TaxID=670 RepID=UPI00111D08BE|nr:DUF6012 family protein [Vibrio parahaemolyticus]EGR0437968.1 hypothetical protein [Vibrio parahaemolyticus]MDZ5208981.1 DUF6012 family protein [Vibrio parahaemolyticus]MQC34078.1 hypothetical protein [Vibrio parahaemolyticus]MQC43382.1 hypothetical protein [Vibrio parahaemolyticus]MQC56811.1 hypothetical protein [Vibrio parahaemolyticus]
MLLHLVPQIMNRYSNVELELIDVQIPELNVTLTGGKDLVVRKPFPNKSYHVACRKVGRKAVHGLYLEVDKQLTNFSVITRWQAKCANWTDEQEKALIHRVNYTVADTDFDVISDDHTMQYAQFEFESRWLTDFRIDPPVNTKPRMDLLICEYHKRGENISLKDEYKDVVMVNRVEDITIPTIEKERLMKRGELDDRLPTLEQRFMVDFSEVEA